MDFHLGDKVLVTTHLSDYELSDGHNVAVVPDMLNYAGKQFVISEMKQYPHAREKLYRLRNNGITARWWFVDKWLVPAEGRVDRY